MFPQQIDITEKTIEKLTQLYLRAYREILAEMEGATEFGTAHRRAILAQIKQILRELGSDVDPILEAEVEKYYKKGADQAAKQLENLGAEVNIATGFNRIHKEAIAAIVDDTARAWGESLQGVNRSAQLLLSKQVKEEITRKLATGKLAGRSLREIKKQIIATLKDDGLVALKDKRGATWSLDRYSEMLIRTKAVEARNRGLANRMVENGYDLVQVSSHGATDVCGKWEGQVLSVTGKTDGYKTVAQAEADGLFHPNCRHAINAFVPGLSDS